MFDKASGLRLIEDGVEPGVVVHAREELRRRRLEQRRERFRQLFAWGDLTEAEYRKQKAEVERDTAMLPDDDELELFDRHRQVMLRMAENVRPPHRNSCGSSSSCSWSGPRHEAASSAP